MISKVRPNGRKPASEKEDVESLYLAFLQKFYETGNREQARKLAVRLETALIATPSYSDSIRAEEIHSLIAELRRDFVQAARSREAEIRKILELHSLAVNTPHWKTVARQYDFSDVSDRLDLLAILYDSQGDLDRAIATLTESQRYCQSHEIPFDGQELLDELQQARTKKTKPIPSHRVSQGRLQTLRDRGEARSRVPTPRS